MIAATIDPVGGSALVVRSLDPDAAGMCSAALIVYIVAPFIAGLVFLTIAPVLDDLNAYLARHSR